MRKWFVLLAAAIVLVLSGCAGSPKADRETVSAAV